ncbi:MAG: AraC family ligand binding domain-containing protein [Actinomycetota bacterium]
MRTTSFAVGADGVVAAVIDRPAWQQFEVYDEKPLRGVRLFEIDEVSGAEFQMVEIAAGGHFAMHTSPDVAFCQIVRGRGKLGMPDDREVEYRGPELYIFHPGSLHDWHDIEEDTLLSVCLIRQG